MVHAPTGKTEKSEKSGSAQTTAHFFRNVPNGTKRTICFSTRNFQIFGVNGKHPRSLCWCYRRASGCYFVVDCNQWTLEYLSPRINGGSYKKLYLVCSVSLDTECNKPRQTSRPAVGTYRQVITLKRVYFIIITFWIMSTVSASAGNQILLEFSRLAPCKVIRNLEPV